MAKQTTEEEFNLRRLSRRRLIGAIALVLLVVILLPVVFDSEPTPSAGNNIDLRIPGKENSPEFQPKINLPELDKMASEVAATSAVASTPATPPAPVAAVASKPAVPVVPPLVVSKPKPEVKVKPEVKPQPVAKPKVESKPVAKPQAVPKSGWVVQVGAFANADTAKNLQTKLYKLGYHAYTEKAGAVLRVRVGSYPTLDAAEKAKSKLAGQGMQANVVNLE
jgi:DedD protein